MAHITSGSYYCDGRFVRYEDIADVPAPMQDDMPTILQNIREKLIAGVENAAFEKPAGVSGKRFPETEDAPADYPWGSR